MTILSIVAILFILSAIVHFSIIAFYGKSPTSTAVVIFGSLYFIIGILILTKVVWIAYVAPLITAIGLIGATVTLKSVPEQRTVTLAMNALDILIIALLGYFFFSS